MDWARERQVSSCDDDEGFFFLTPETIRLDVSRSHPISILQMQMNLPLRSQGAEILKGGGVRYRTWAPGKQVTAVISSGAGGKLREVSLGAEPHGYWSGIDPQGRPGDRYKYRFDGNDWPDPASRFNPDGVHGAAQVIDPRDYSWNDANWIAPPLSELIIYELHIGTFTTEGTFRAAIEKLDHLVKLGVTGVEIMRLDPGDEASAAALLGRLSR